MTYKILAVNPGSTSTKIAVFEGDACVFSKTIRHGPDDLKGFGSTSDQFEFRYHAVLKAIEESGSTPGSMDAFVGRGGIFKPLKGGTYSVGQEMLQDARTSKYGDHASNLGALIVSMLKDEFHKPAYVVDPPVVDELSEEARMTGLPEIKRVSVFHALNQKAAAVRAALDAGIPYNEGRFIVAHLGGGVSVGAHEKGQVVDVNNALEEGPFSPERAGTLPSGQLVDLCFSGRYSREEIKKMLVGKGGLFAYTGTTDCIKLEQEAAADDKIRKLLEAFAYKVSREICASAAALSGKPDTVVITGGLAYSSLIVDEIFKRVSFLGKVAVYPGEDELAALAQGAMRVLEGKEQALDY